MSPSRRPQAVRLAAISACLRRWIAATAPEALPWLDDRAERIAGGASDALVFTSFSAVPRHTGKADLNLDARELGTAGRVRPGWQPRTWSVDQAGRTLLLLSLPTADLDAYDRRLHLLFSAADVGELVALQQALPLLPLPSLHLLRATNGVRSNVTPVFTAVMHRNPYPAEQFSDNAFNQGVLKAIFVGVPLHLIHGLDARANLALAQMLVDYAHERWAAARPVTPELWRAVGPFAEGPVLDDLLRVLRSHDRAEQEAAALALAASPSPSALSLLHAGRPDLHARIRRGTLSWAGASSSVPLGR